MINTANVEKTKAQIKRSTAPVIVKAQDDNFNRKMLEYGKFSILLSPESGKREGSLRQTDSGLNHVLAKIAAKNNVSIGIDLEEVRSLGKKEKAVRLEKIKQNIKICRKANAKIKVLNIKDKKEAFHLMISLGASTKQASEC